MAVTFIDTMMSCASSDTLGVTNFWPRAQTALVTGAAAERRWPAIVSRTARKLEVPDGGIYEREAAALAALGQRLNDEALARWCEIVASDAPYIVAMCRIARQARKAKKQSEKRAATSEEIPY